MDFSTNKTTKNVDNTTYNVAIAIRNNYYGYNSNGDTTC